MTRALCLALLAVMLLMLGHYADAALRIGNTLPPLVLPGLNGVPVRIPDNFKGKVVILHFWAIGCSSCRLEIPALDGLYSQYRRRGLEVLAVNVGQRKQTVKAFAAEVGVSYPILVDADGKSAAVYEVTDIPRTYIIDRNGVIRYRIAGGATPAILKKLVLSLL